MTKGIIAFIAVIVLAILTLSIMPEDMALSKATQVINISQLYHHSQLAEIIERLFSQG